MGEAQPTQAETQEPGSASFRDARLADRFAIIALSRQFIESLELFSFDPVYIERTVKEYILDPEKLCLVYEVDGEVVGFFFAMTSPHPFFPVKVANELAWWVDPEYRGLGSLKVLRLYQDWARAKGCELVGMGALWDDRLKNLFERFGFREAETNYLKVI